MNWPSWWDWDLGFTPHLEMRMEERGFSEVELRAMFDAASKCGPGRQPGRWVIETTQEGRPWCVVVEPDSDDQVLMVVTAYPTGTRG